MLPTHLTSVPRQATLRDCGEIDAPQLHGRRDIPQIDSDCDDDDLRAAAEDAPRCWRQCEIRMRITCCFLGSFGRYMSIFIDETQSDQFTRLWPLLHQLRLYGGNRC